MIERYICLVMFGFCLIFFVIWVYLIDHWTCNIVHKLVYCAFYLHFWLLQVIIFILCIGYHNFSKRKESEYYFLSMLQMMKNFIGILKNCGLTSIDLKADSNGLVQVCMMYNLVNTHAWQLCNLMIWLMCWVSNFQVKLQDFVQGLKALSALC